MRNPLHGLTQASQIFIRCIVCGDSPEMAVKIAFPLKKNQDVWAAKLLAKPRVQHAIDVLTKGKVTPHARRIELIKIIDNQEVSAATRLGALKELGVLERAEKEKPTDKKAVREDEALNEKLFLLGKKAAS